MKYGYLVTFGSLGLITRYFLAQSFIKFNHLYLGTLLANLLGCFLIGLLWKNPFNFSDNIKLALLTGFCGCLTTFSTFIFELLKCIETKSYFGFSIYLILSISLGLVLTILGMKSSELI